MMRSQMFTAARLDLDHSMSMGFDAQCASAQYVVDSLHHHGFPVQNVEIVSSELRSIERVIGR